MASALPQNLVRGLTSSTWDEPILMGDSSEYTVEIPQGPCGCEYGPVVASNGKSLGCKITALGHGQAARSGAMGVGDVVSSLNGRDLLAEPFGVVMEALKDAEGHAGGRIVGLRNVRAGLGAERVLVGERRQSSEYKTMRGGWQGSSVVVNSSGTMDETEKHENGVGLLVEADLEENQSMCSSRGRDGQGQGREGSGSISPSSTLTEQVSSSPAALQVQGRMETLKQRMSTLAEGVYARQMTRMKQQRDAKTELQGLERLGLEVEDRLEDIHQHCAPISSSWDEREQLKDEREQRPGSQEEEGEQAAAPFGVAPADLGGSDALHRRHSSAFTSFEHKEQQQEVTAAAAALNGNSSAQDVGVLKQGGVAVQTKKTTNAFEPATAALEVELDVATAERKAAGKELKRLRSRLSSIKAEHKETLHHLERAQSEIANRRSVEAQLENEMLRQAKDSDAVLREGQARIAALELKASTAEACLNEMLEDKNREIRGLKDAQAAEKRVHLEITRAKAALEQRLPELEAEARRAGQLEVELRLAMDHAADQRRELASLTDYINSLRAEHRSELSHREEVEERLRAALASVEREAAASKIALGHKLTAAEATRDEAEERAREESAGLRQAEKDVAMEKERAASMEALLSETKKALGASQQKVATEEGRVRALQGRIMELEYTEEEERKRTATLEDRCQALEKENSSCEHRLAQADAFIELVEQKRGFTETLVSRVEEVQAALAVEQKEVKDERERCLKLEADLTERNRKAREMQKEIEDLKREVQDASRSHAVISEQLRLSKVTEAALTARQQPLTTELEQARSERDMILAKLAKKDAEALELHARHEAAVSELSAVKKDMVLEATAANARRLQALQAGSTAESNGEHAAVGISSVRVATAFTRAFERMHAEESATATATATSTATVTSLESEVQAASPATSAS
ncbi:unnamed protein product [Chrysoparadoxa australica]